MRRLLNLTAAGLAIACALIAAPAAGGDVRVTVSVLTPGKQTVPGAGAVVWVVDPAAARAAAASTRPRIASKKKRFDPHVAVVPEGGTVQFPNLDGIYHNVFSLSENARFDLGLYRNGASRTMTFENPGPVRIYCNIHPQMAAVLVVIDGGIWAQAGADGVAVLPHCRPERRRCAPGTRKAARPRRPSRCRPTAPFRSRSPSTVLDGGRRDTRTSTGGITRLPTTMATGTDDGRADTRRSTSSEATRVTRTAPETTLVSAMAASAPPPKPVSRGPGLATQFFVAAAVLVVATLGAAIALGTWRANEAAEKSIRESLRDLPGVVGSYQISLEEGLRRQLTSVADEPGTKGLFALRDQKTLHDWTVDKAQAGKLDAGAVFLFKEQWR